MSCQGTHQNSQKKKVTKQPIANYGIFRSTTRMNDVCQFLDCSEDADSKIDSPQLITRGQRAEYV